jgi:hypothetical protein
MKRPSRAAKAPTPRARKKAPAEAAPPPSEVAVESLVEAPLPADLATTHVEPAFANRVSPAPPDRPFPSSHRAIFFDVENTSRAAHIARVIEHLAVDRVGRRTDFVAVGNWRVIGHDTARLLARHGAHLVHSAPSVGVRDWSDLRIAVAAGVWLASARPGDVIEIVSDDRAFDAVGDVSTSLGIAFRRLSFRGLTGDGPRPAEVMESAPAQPSSGGRHHSRRRGRGGWRDRQPAPRTEAALSPPAPARAHVPRPQLPQPQLPQSQMAEEPHTAPLDELVTIVQDLVKNASGRVVTIDTLANALKSRGFSRPPGSPRLITRLRRIKELTVSRSGAITLTGGDGAAASALEELEPADHAPNLPEAPAERAPWPSDSGEDLSVGPGNEMPASESGAVTAGPGPAGSGPRRGRRSRRGGRRHRRHGAGAPAPAS